MAWELSEDGGYFKAKQTVAPYIYNDYPVDNVTIREVTSDSFIFEYYGVVMNGMGSLSISDLTAENGTDFTDLASFISWKNSLLEKKNSPDSITNAGNLNKFANLVSPAPNVWLLLSSFNGAFDPHVNIMTVAQTFVVTYDQTVDGLGQTGATQLLVTYIDGSFNEVQSVHILGNTGSDTTSFSGLGINRVVVIANGGIGHNVANIDLTASVDSTIQARVPALLSVTQQLIFHTPIGYTALISHFFINAIKTSGGGAIVNIRGYSYSRVTNTSYEVIHLDYDTASGNSSEIPFGEDPFRFTGREVIYFLVQVDSNNVNISGNLIGRLNKS